METSEVLNEIGMTLIPISPGIFSMGLQDPSLKGVLEDAWPSRPVQIIGTRLMSARLVTVQQWITVMKGEQRGGMYTSSTLPKTRVSWFDAMAFCNRLSELPAERNARRVYRLPTEAEWEYMCKAGSEELYSYGIAQDHLGEYAWYEGSWPAENWRNRRKLQALSSSLGMLVGAKLPNRWGLYDLHGNVYEWCLDTYDKTLYQFLSGKLTMNPVFLAHMRKRSSHAVVRGGDFLSPAIECSCIARFPYGRTRTARNGHLGFRVVVDDPDNPLRQIEGMMEPDVRYNETIS